MLKNILLILMLASTPLVFNGCAPKVKYVTTPRPYLQKWEVLPPKPISYEVYEVDEVDEVNKQNK